MRRPWTVRRANGHSWQYLLASPRAPGGAKVKRRWGSEEAAREAAQKANAGDGAP